MNVQLTVVQWPYFIICVYFLSYQCWCRSINMFKILDVWDICVCLYTFYFLYYSQYILHIYILGIENVHVFCFNYMSICSCTFKYFAHDLGKFEYQLPVLVSIYRMIHELCWFVWCFFLHFVSLFSIYMYFKNKKKFQWMWMSKFL